MWTWYGMGTVLPDIHALVCECFHEVNQDKPVLHVLLQVSDLPYHTLEHKGYNKGITIATNISCRSN